MALASYGAEHTCEIVNGDLFLRNRHFVKIPAVTSRETEIQEGKIMVSRRMAREIGAYAAAVNVISCQDVEIVTGVLISGSSHPENVRVA